MKYRPALRLLTSFALLGTAALLAACSTSPGRPSAVAPPAEPAAEEPAAAMPAPASGAVGIAPQAAPEQRPAMAIKTSHASNARAYRSDAARHIYGMNEERIWKGRLPPMLYAVGVLQVEVDAGGQVRHLNWMRAPRHAPEVIAEIEKTVRAAAPFPLPARLGKVVYTDTWLWDKSGRFQLDTLSEGQD